MYVVLLIILIIWIGIFSYIWSLDKKVKKLENRK
ncbi:MAG: CcmD family protein [Ignavibacteriaceae bacterium]